MKEHRFLNDKMERFVLYLQKIMSETDNCIILLDWPAAQHLHTRGMRQGVGRLAKRLAGPTLLAHVHSTQCYYKLLGPYSETHVSFLRTA